MSGVFAGEMTTVERKKIVLVVDDDPAILRFIRLGLMAHGYEAVTAVDGQEALEVIRTRNPDIVILDILLPKKDGLSVLGELRGFSDVPVVAMSAHTSLREKALSLGASDFLDKPFSPDELLRRIGIALSHGPPGTS